jgi:hypothetical protein
MSTAHTLPPVGSRPRLRGLRKLLHARELHGFQKDNTANRRDYHKPALLGYSHAFSPQYGVFPRNMYAISPITTTGITSETFNCAHFHYN